MSEVVARAGRDHIVTVNVEDYFQVGAFREIIPDEHWERFENRIQRNTEAVLTLLEETNNTATFFASGWIGENYGGILRTIAAHGHEVACSGYFQQSIRDIPPPAFKQDLRRSRKAVEDAIGSRVAGFRIGKGRIGPDDLWALEVLQSEQFVYDSSICPIGRQFTHEHQRFRLHRHETRQGDIWEVPPSAMRKLGWAFPFSGGNYMRQFPEWPVREAVARWVEAREAPLVMYFHVWELDSEQPNISGASWLQRVRHYRNIDKMPGRVRFFLEKYPFTSVRNYLDLTHAPADTTRAFRFPERKLSKSPADHETALIDMTILIPCYNEEVSLEYLARTLARFVEQSRTRIRTRFVLIDDGSTDGTWAKMQLLFGGSNDFTLLQHSENKGIAFAILTGAAEATTDLVAVIDADCTFDPLQLTDMVDKMDDSVDVVCASPLHPEGSAGDVPGWRLLLSHGAAFLYRCVLRHQFSSYTSCFRIYRREVLEDMSVCYGGFCGVAEILARLDQQGYRLREHPAKLHVRVLGQSKINLATTVFEHLKLVARLAAARWLSIPLPQERGR